MSELLNFAEDKLQLMALATMAVVYALRIRWFLKFKAGKDRQPPTGRGDTNPKKGILYSWANIAMPWAMESTRTKFLLYAQFTIFHIGVASSILLSFVIPYAPGLMTYEPVVRLFQLATGAACAVGVYRIYRRLSKPVMKAISTPDDYFSLMLLTVWLFSATLAAPNRPDLGEGSLLAFFFLTAFFLIYVPFSKISHYLYYPFTRYYFGKTMGHRGVYPLKRGHKSGPIPQSGN